MDPKIKMFHAGLSDMEKLEVEVNKFISTVSLRNLQMQYDDKRVVIMVEYK